VGEAVLKPESVICCRSPAVLRTIVASGKLRTRNPGTFEQKTTETRKKVERVNKNGLF
jgi:hypothetical protein